jgi:general secretion pathway protein L
MATTLLKRTAAIWVPPRSVGERALAAEPSLVAMLPAPESSGGVRWARVSLEALPAMKSAALVFDARDVTLMPVKLPPLSGARLARALPNLVEDALLQDVHGCAFALGPRVGDESRLVAVIDRSWLEFVVGAIERRGVRVSAAWPAQLVLPTTPGEWSIACVHDGLAVRTGEFEGFGWTASSDADSRAEALVAAAEAGAQVSGRPQAIAAFAETRDWQAGVESAGQRIGVPIAFSGLAAPQPAPVDLLDARQGSASGRWLSSVDWRALRFPAALALACVLAWLIGLNLHWGQLARERAQLRAEMERSFRQTFPNAQVVVDPLLQMQRQVSDLRLRAGQSGPDDFLPLLARFAGALGPRANDALAALEYRDGKLRARFRADFLEGPAARESLRAALRQRGLQLEFEGEGDALAVVSLQT